MKLTICIPTYNRKEYLAKNLKILINIIRVQHYNNDVRIFVSDNNSNDGTEEYISSIIMDNKDIVIDYNKNKENMGAIYNVLYMLSNTDSEYIMLLGDDDYISKEYLDNTLKSINDNIECIVPSYVNILPDGTLTGRGRDVGLKSKIYKKGFKNCLANSWRGHQLSGLVVRRDTILKECEDKKIFNPYLQIYWIGYSCMIGKTLHLTEYPVKVTTPPKGGKTWGYGKDGLVSEVFVNYKLLDNVTFFQRHLLEMKFLSKQYWRYAMYIKMGPLKFISCISKIISSKNTSKLTKIIFPLTFILILVCKAFALLFSGELFNTLKTKVDI